MTFNFINYLLFFFNSTFPFFSFFSDCNIQHLQSCSRMTMPDRSGDTVSDSTNMKPGSESFYCLDLFILFIILSREKIGIVNQKNNEAEEQNIGKLVIK